MIDDADLDLVETRRLVDALSRRMDAKKGHAVIALCFPTGAEKGDVFYFYTRSEASLCIAEALVSNIGRALEGDAALGWDGIEDR